MDEFQTIFVFTVLLEHYPYDINLCILYYVSSALYKLKPKCFLERYRKLYIGEPSKTWIVSKDFDERYKGLIVKRNEYTYLVKVFNCWYDVPKMLVPYI